MDSFLKLDKYLDATTKFFGLASRLGILIGFLVFVFYCYSIGYFPEGISAGDTIALAFVSIAFGGLYVFFLLCLYAIGIKFWWLWVGLSYLAKPFFLLKNKISKTESIGNDKIEYLKGDWSLWVFVVFGLAMIVGFGFIEPFTVMTTFLCCWFFAVAASVNRTLSSRLYELKRHDGSKGSCGSEEKPDDSREVKIDEIRKKQILLLILVLLFPLFIAGQSGRLMDGAMRLLNVRADSVIIHIKEPYNNLFIGHGFQGESSYLGNEYTRFSNLSVLLRGIGTHTVVGVDPSEKSSNMPIPNASVVVDNVNNSMQPTANASAD